MLDRWVVAPLHRRGDARLWGLFEEVNGGEAEEMA
jgi:hypothetical protein